MSLFTVNNGEASSFEPLPVGEYEVFINETKVVESKEKHTPGVEMKMIVRDEPDINPVGRKKTIFHTMWYTEKTGGMFQALFKAAFVPEGAKLDTLEDVAKELKGRFVRVKIKHEMYEGEPRVRVSYFSQSQKPLSKVHMDDPMSGMSGGTPGGLDIPDDDLPF
jgi:hypothetical protein